VFSAEVGEARTWAGLHKKPRMGNIHSSEAEREGIPLRSPGILLSPLHRALQVTNADGYTLLV